MTEKHILPINKDREAKLAKRLKVPAEYDTLGIENIVDAKNTEELRIALEGTKNLYKEAQEDTELALLQEVVQSYSLDTTNDANRDKFIQKLNDYLTSCGVETGVLLQQNVHPSDFNTVIKVRNALIKDYKAQSITELMLIDTAVSAYFRLMKCNKVYNLFLIDKEGVTDFRQERVNMMKELSKQLDISHRQFISAISFIKDLKQPPVKVKINTKQAFVAQNQQINQSPNDLGKNVKTISGEL